MIHLLLQKYFCGPEKSKTPRRMAFAVHLGVLNHMVNVL